MSRVEDRIVTSRSASVDCVSGEKSKRRGWNEQILRLRIRYLKILEPLPGQPSAGNETITAPVLVTYNAVVISVSVPLYLGLKVRYYIIFPRGLHFFLEGRIGSPKDIHQSPRGLLVFKFKIIEGVVFKSVAVSKHEFYRLQDLAFSLHF